ncbi:MAG: SRPBCC family protein [Acidimicrobiales bacterium]|jgi:hypothetical protein
MTVAGMYNEETIDIAASPDVVYGLVSDLARMGEWSPETTGGRWLDGGAGAVGDQFEGDNQIGDRKWSAVAEVTVAQPGTKFEFVTGPPEGRFVRWTYRLAPNGEGTTVTEVWDVEILPGTLAKFTEDQLAGRASAVASSMQATLAGVKAAAEG